MGNLNEEISKNTDKRLHGEGGMEGEDIDLSYAR